MTNTDDRKHLVCTFAGIFTYSLIVLRTILGGLSPAQCKYPSDTGADEIENRRSR